MAAEEMWTSVNPNVVSWVQAEHVDRTSAQSFPFLESDIGATLQPFKGASENRLHL